MVCVLVLQVTPFHPMANLTGIRNVAIGQNVLEKCGFYTNIAVLGYFLRHPLQLSSLRGAMGLVN